MTEQMDNIEFLRKLETCERREARSVNNIFVSADRCVDRANAFARCAEEIEAARKAKPVHADVAGLVKEQRSYSGHSECYAIMESAARAIESLTPPVDGVQNNCTKCSGKGAVHVPGCYGNMAVLCDVCVGTGKTFGQSTPTPAPQDDRTTMALDAIQDHVNMTVRTLAQTSTTSTNHNLISTAETELDHISSEVARLRRLTPSPAGEGYVLVPVEPTEEMLDAAPDSASGGKSDFDRAIYKAMLAARPPIPTASSAGVLHAFRNADAKDWQHLFLMLPESGHGQFWKAVMLEVRAALASANGGEK